MGAIWLVKALAAAGTLFSWGASVPPCGHAFVAEGALFYVECATGRILVE